MVTPGVRRRRRAGPRRIHFLTGGRLRGDTLGLGGPTTTLTLPGPTRRLTPLLLLLACALALAPQPAPAELQAYFSPDGGIQAALRAHVDAATDSIDVAIFDFTGGELADALVRARDRGVAVRVVADARQARGKHSAIPRLKVAGLDVHLMHGRGRGIMHHKFAVFEKNQ